MEQDLQHADPLVGDLRARHALEERLAHFVGHLRRGQLLLGLADRADFRKRVDAGRHVIDEAPAVVLDDIARRRTPLVVRRTGQARPADHIARRIDVGNRGAVVLVHLDLPTAVDLDADVLQAQAIGVAGAAVTPQQRIRLDLLARLQVQDHAVFQAFDAVVFLVVTDQHVVVAQVIAQRIGNLVVEEAEQLVAGIDQVYQHAEAAEDRRIFAADHPGSVDDQPARSVAEGEDSVAVVDPRVVEVDVRGTIGTRAGGDDELVGGQALDRPLGRDHFHGALIDEAGGAIEHVDAIARVVTGVRGHLLGDDLLGTLQYVREGEPARLADLAEHRVGVELDDLLHRMTQGLGRDGPEVRAVAADHAPTVHHRQLAPVLGCVHRCTLARRPRAENHHVVVVDSHAYSFRTNRSTPRCPW
ncbi:hypothetical protein D3C81_1068590 [compost metagenome]